jgi:hypothetical protein
VCTGCLYGKAKRKPWRTKPTREGARSRVATQPGECVSVDQMVSSTPGLIAQMRGIPTTKRYTCATVFVDQATGYGYIHLQKSTGAEEMLVAKAAFETHMNTVAVSIRHYHSDNGIFADNGFREACKGARHHLTFCRVNAHFQNGVAERRIGSLTTTARTMLVHTKRRWPTAIAANLWPYAFRHANEVLNHLPRSSDRRGDHQCRPYQDRK